MRYINFLLFSMLIVCASASARTGAACASGNWNDQNTWLFSGVHSVPDCGDTLSISSSYTVTVNATQNLSSCTAANKISVAGILQFTNGNRLQLNCNSIIYLLAGGTIQKSGPGGGNSTNITICGITEWKAGDGPVTGPAVLGDITLPVTLLFVDARQEDEKVNIVWATASEIYNDYFMVERSDDGKTFTEVSKVKGIGNSTVTNDYSAYDQKPVNGLSYYRLKQTDFDGRTDYSGILAVNFKGKMDAEIHAVSANSNSNLSVFFSASGFKMFEVEILNMNGNVVYDENVMAEEGNNSKSFSIPSLSTGSYILSLKGSSNAVRKLFSIK